MVIRVEAADESAQPLVDELVGIFGSECVSLENDGDVHIHPAAESNRALIRALGAVETWLNDSRIDSTSVWVDDHSYRVDRRPRLRIKT